MSPLERRLRTLLRWYPRAWRERHGEVMLAALLDDAEARGLDRPTAADAWSIRMHGLAERSTPRAAALVAGIGLFVAALTTSARQLVRELTTTPEGQIVIGTDWLGGVWITMGVGVVPAIVAIAVIMLAAWHRASPAALIAACAGVAAAVGVLVGAALRTVVEPVVTRGSDGRETTVIGVPPGTALVAAGAIVAASVLPLVRARIPLRRDHRLAWLIAVVGALAVGVIGVAFAQTSLFSFVAIAVVLFALTGYARDAGRAASTSAPRRAWSPIAVGLLGSATILFALPTTAFGLLVAIDAVPVAPDGMRAVGAVLVGSGLTLAVALALVLRPLLGAAVWLPVAAFAAATIATAAVVLEPGRPTGPALNATAAACAGLGVALVILMTAPGGAAARATVALVVGVSSAALLGQLFVMPYVASVVWLLAVPLVALAVVRHRRADREPATP